MKKLTLILILTAGVLGNQAWSQIVFKEERVEHQAGLLEDQAEAVFHFTNTGDETVIIKDVRSSCGCTIPKLEKKEYAPGESGEIHAVFTFGARVGTQMKRISVETDGPGNRSYELNMVTHIPEWVELEPRILRWKANTPATPQQFRVKVIDSERISLDEAMVEMKAFEVKRELQSPNVYLYTVTPKDISQRATEFLSLTVTATENEVSRSRPYGVHCLIR